MTTKKKELTLIAPVKHDTDKVRLELLPPEALLEIGKALTYGAVKYDDDNWRRGDGFRYSRLIGSTLRHTVAWMRGERTDDETGLSHLTHAACCLMFLITYEATGTGIDDTPKGGGNG